MLRRAALSCLLDPLHFHPAVLLITWNLPVLLRFWSCYRGRAGPSCHLLHLDSLCLVPSTRPLYPRLVDIHRPCSPWRECLPRKKQAQSNTNSAQRLIRGIAKDCWRHSWLDAPRRRATRCCWHHHLTISPSPSPSSFTDGAEHAPVPSRSREHSCPSSALLPFCRLCNPRLYP